MAALKILATFAIGGKTSPLKLLVAQGSVVDFQCLGGGAVGAIVNAANERCLGGGGVDGAISDAGGPNLLQDRLALPMVSEKRKRGKDAMVNEEAGIRCRTGDAVMTGPGEYGELKVSFVVHAVGPNYHRYDNFATPDKLLRSAYQTSLDCCQEHGVTEVAFALLSAGIFRGQRKSSQVLAIGIQAIQDWAMNKLNGPGCSLKSIILCGFTEKETNLLVKSCNRLLEHEDRKASK